MNNERPDWASNIERLPIKFSPISDRVVIVPTTREAEEVKSHYSENVKGLIPEQGEIIAMGNGKYSQQGIRIPMEVKIGEIVMYSRHAGDDFLLNKDGTFRQYEGSILSDTLLIKIISEAAILSPITYASS